MKHLILFIVLLLPSFPHAFATDASGKEIPLLDHNFMDSRRDLHKEWLDRSPPALPNRIPRAHNHIPRWERNIIIPKKRNS